MELTTKMMDAAIARGAKVIIGTVEVRSKSARRARVRSTVRS
jgi:hypothetical protein